MLFWKGAGTDETANDRAAELFDAVAATDETWAEPLSPRLAEVVHDRTSVRARDDVLDIDAGTGALAHQAAALGARVTAIDLSSAVVARLAQRLAPYSECRALVMDGQALAFEDSTFDTAFSILSTILFPAWDAELDDAVRLVWPGGSIGIVHWANPEGADVFSILSRALTKLPRQTGSPDPPELAALMSVHEIRVRLAIARRSNRRCQMPRACGSFLRCLTIIRSRRFGASPTNFRSPSGPVGWSRPIMVVQARSGVS